MSSEPDATCKQIRGSSLFLAGRFLSMEIDFSAQVLMVRYLAAAEYGGLAYLPEGRGQPQFPHLVRVKAGVWKWDVYEPLSRTTFQASRS